MSESSSSVTHFHGRIPGSASPVEIRCSETILAVDDIVGGSTQALPFVAPGFIDLQVNGFAGVDYNDPSVATVDVARSLDTMFSTGVTRCFPTIITGSAERMFGAAKNLNSSRAELKRQGHPGGDAIAGLHIEGPHLSPEDGPRGAHPLEHIRPPNTAEFDRLQEAADGLIRLVTISPEWDQAPDYIRHLVRSGVVASIGHTKATREQIAAAVEAGATMSTHLGNAAHSVLPKTQNYIYAQLAEDRLIASFITDGIHLPPEFVRAAVRAKGVERSVVVTDAVMPAMCAPGPYQLGQVQVELQADGKVVLRNDSGRLAGSALRMDVAIENVVRMCGLTLREALVMATTNAARAGRIAGRQRGLEPGEKADLVFFSWSEPEGHLRVERTVVAGQLAYQSA